MKQNLPSEAPFGRPGCVVDDNRKEASCVTVAGSGGTQFHPPRQAKPWFRRKRTRAAVTPRVRDPAVSSEKEKFAASDGGPRLSPGCSFGQGIASAMPGLMALAVGCGAQARKKGIWWMPWH